MELSLLVYFYLFCGEVGNTSRAFQTERQAEKVSGTREVVQSLARHDTLATATIRAPRTKEFFCKYLLVGSGTKGPYKRPIYSDSLSIQAREYARRRCDCR